ncbi:hypothetical protein ACX0G7_20000 [Flavitalea antarctica]
MTTPLSPALSKRVTTYSLLAYINNKQARTATYESIFIPIVKRGLSKMVSLGVKKGEDIRTVLDFIDQLYDIDMPITVLKKLLKVIENEANHSSETPAVKFYEDWSFIINNYYFDEYEDEIEKRESEIQRLQEIYEAFVRSESNESAPTSIFHFIEQGKFSLGKYIKSKYPSDFQDHTIEARFIKFIEPIAGFYELVQSIYLGAIISIYLEYSPSDVKKDVELVLDTNFVISLLDLNTSASTQNCRRLVEISRRLGYRFSILSITLKEIDNLLTSRVQFYNEYFLGSLADPEDIYNACKRRSLNRADLDKIRIDVQHQLENFGVVIIPNVDKYINLAKNGDLFSKLKGKRNTDFAALHDATCMEYVKAKRIKQQYSFDRVNCWFLNNSSSRATLASNGFQPFTIKSEDLLNLLWLTSPMVKDIVDQKEFSNIGLSRLVSSTLDDSLPKSQTIRELDDNIKKYANENLKDEDILRVAKAVAERTIKNLDKINDLAENDSAAFVKKLQEIADHEKEKEDARNQMYYELVSRTREEISQMRNMHQSLSDAKDEYQDKYQEHQRVQTDTINLNAEIVEVNKRLKREKIDLLNQIRMEKRTSYTAIQKSKWRRRSWLHLVLLSICVIALLFGYAGIRNWDFTDFYNNAKNSNLGVVFTVLVGICLTIISVVIIPSLREKYYNLSIIEKFEQRLTIPEEFRQLPYENE